jgi:hypothetical protein
MFKNIKREINFLIYRTIIKERFGGLKTYRIFVEELEIKEIGNDLDTSLKNISRDRAVGSSCGS